jgi:hypothetical protein
VLSNESGIHIPTSTCSDSTRDIWSTAYSIGELAFSHQSYITVTDTVEEIWSSVD